MALTVSAAQSGGAASPGMPPTVKAATGRAAV